MTGDGDTEFGPDGDDLAAAEYVLGVMSAPERAAFAKRIEENAALGRLVDAWELRLSPLDVHFAPVSAPVTVKAAIDRRLFAGTGQRQPGGWFSSLGFWRSATAAALVAAVIAVAPNLSGYLNPPSSGEPIIAPLQSDTGVVRFVALYDPAKHDIRVTTVDAQKEGDRDYELWLVDGPNKPESMGVMIGSTTVFHVGESVAMRIDAGDAFAISIEPRGGSPTGQATGPIIAVGVTRAI